MKPFDWCIATVLAVGMIAFLVFVFTHDPRPEECRDLQRACENRYFYCMMTKIEIGRCQLYWSAK